MANDKKRAVDLAAFAKTLADMPNLNVASLSKDDVIEVETQNHVYTMIVIDPATGLVEAMSNGTLIRDPIELYLRGSLIGSTSLWTKRIAVGYSLELGEFTLTPTKSVVLNGVKILPRSELLH